MGLTVKSIFPITLSVACCFLGRLSAKTFRTSVLLAVFVFSLASVSLPATICLGSESRLPKTGLSFYSESLAVGRGLFHDGQRRLLFSFSVLEFTFTTGLFKASRPSVGSADSGPQSRFHIYSARVLLQAAGLHGNLRQTQKRGSRK